MEWQSTFSVDIAEFDEHHRHLFDLINEAHDSCINGTQSEYFSDIVLKLAEYVSFHFTAEEQFMEDHGYQHLAEHREEHMQFCKKISDAIKLMPSGVGTIELIDLTSFLMEWLFHHIQEVDQQYSKLVQGNYSSPEKRILVA